MIIDSNIVCEQQRRSKLLAIVYRVGNQELVKLAKCPDVSLKNY